MVLRILAIVALYASFGVVHTVLAKLSIKDRVAARYPGFMRYYRLSYNIFALIHLYIVYELSPSIDVRLYDAPFPFDLFIVAIEIAALAGAAWSLQYFNIKEFLGIGQLMRDFEAAPGTSIRDEQLNLVTRGPFALCRHPLYFFSIVLLVARPYMFLDYLVSLICIIAYFYIGAWYEEKRLLTLFGDEYRNYMEETPFMLPVGFLKRPSE